MTKPTGDGRTLAPLFTWRSAIADSDLPPTTRLVAYTLALHMNERGGSCYPAIDTIARESGLSKRAVQDHLRVLDERGWMVCELGGGRRSNRYTAAVPRGAAPAPLPRTTRTPGVQEVHPTPAAPAPEVFIEGDIEHSMEETHGSQLPTIVDRRKVTDSEGVLACQVLVAWNREAKQALTARDWLAKIIMRHREHPSLSADDHAAIIQRVLTGDRWWKGPPTPSIIYGNAAQFERSIMTAKQPTAGQGAYDVALEEAQRMEAQR